MIIMFKIKKNQIKKKFEVKGLLYVYAQHGYVDWGLPESRLHIYIHHKDTGRYVSLK